MTYDRYNCRCLLEQHVGHEAHFLASEIRTGSTTKQFGLVLCLRSGVTARKEC
jgi:hypothetical protein